MSAKTWALSVLKRIIDKQPPMDPPEDDEGGDGDCDGPSNDAEDVEVEDGPEGEGKGKGKPKGEPKDDDSDDDGDDDRHDDDGDDEEGRKGGPKGEDEGEGKGKGDGEGDDGDGDGGDGPPDDGGVVNSDGEGGSGRSQGGIDKPLDANDFANLDWLNPKEIRDPNVTVKNEEGDSSAPVDVAQPIIILDPVVTPVLDPNAQWGTESSNEWLKELRTIRVSGVRLALRRLMQKSDFAGREGGLRSGRLSGHGINRLIVGSENVFERRYDVEGESVAVSLLIDGSGSMGGPKMVAATTTALLLAETAQNAGAKIEVVTFSSAFTCLRDGLEGQLAAEKGLASAVVGRNKGAWMFGESSRVSVFKSFDDGIGRLRRLFHTMRSSARGGTNDASALLWVGKRLLKQDVNRRILFVIEDGEGDDVGLFRHTVTELEKQGVIVIGIGIGCQASFLKRFTYCTTIVSPADLCGKMFGMLIATIAKAKRFA